MKNVTVYFGMSVLIFFLMISCQKDLLNNPVSYRTLSISTDTTKQILVLSTDQSNSDVKTSTLSVDWLKTFSATAGDHDYFILKSNTTWQIVSYPSWVTVSPMSGSGNQDVTVTVQANQGAQRSGVIVISGAGVTNYVTINVLQLAGSSSDATLSVDWLKVFSATAGDHDYFMVTSNTSWKIVSYPSWLTVNPLSGTGNADVTVTVQANTGAERTGTITLSGTDVAQNVSINALQLGSTATPSPSQVPPTTPTTPTSADTVYFPFTSLGYSILNKYLMAPSSVTTTGDLIATNGAVDFEQNYYENDDASAGSLIHASGATSATSVKVLNNVIKGNNALGTNNNTTYIVIVGSDATITQTGMYNGAQFIGNSLTGGGSTLSSDLAHGFFLGFSAGGTWMYNFIENNAYGCQTKADGLDNSIGGSISYNCIKNPKQAIAIKGIMNTLVYNNTVYMDNTVLNYAVGIEISPSDDGTHSSTGTVIKNNIIYSAGTSPFMIQVNDYGSLSNLQCDYNIYYVAGGSPEFIYVDSNGNTQYASFSQWQSLGFDAHSVVVNPNLDPNTLIPASPLYYAASLGSNYNTGIDPSNEWDRTATITKSQGSTWENGAFIK